VDIKGQRGMDAWVEEFTILNGNLERFNSLMHNKLQLYTSDLAPFVASLTNASVPLLKRRSKDPDGVAVAHVGFAVAGRIYELVGPLISLPGRAPLPWNAEECAVAHTLVAPLSTLEKSSKQSSVTVDTMMVGIGITHHDPTGPGTAVTFDHLARFTGANVSVMPTQDSCSVVDLQWGSMPNIAVRYVGSSAYPGPSTLAAYDQYAQADHANSTLSHPFGRGWDHVLDQHLGLWYGGGATDCGPRAEAVREALLAQHLPVGERDEPDAHLFYVGYQGPMSWEYQFQHCNAGHPEAGAECACHALNRPADDGSCPRNHTDGTNWCI